MGRFLDHVNAVLRDMRQPAITSLSTDANTAAFVAQEAVRTAIFEIWNDKSWSFRQKTDTFATVASQISYVLPKRVGEPYIALLSASPYHLTAVDPKVFDRRVPNPTSSGPPHVFTMWDHLNIENQPTAVSQLGIASSETGDTTQSIFIKGIVGGQEDSETVTLNGTTSVVSVKSYTSIYSISKSAVTAGRVTVTSNGGAVMNIVMAPNELVSQLRATRLYPIPSSILTVTIKHFSLPPVITDANEDIMIPYRWDNVVNQFAYSYALQTKGKNQIQEMTVKRNLADALLGSMRVDEKQSEAEPLRALRWGDEKRGIDRWSRVDGQFPISSP